VARVLLTRQLETRAFAAHGYSVLNLASGKVCTLCLPVGQYLYILIEPTT